MLASNSGVQLLRRRTSVVGFLRMAIEPAVAVGTLLVCCVCNDIEFGGQEVVLALIVFSLMFPGEVSLRRLKQSLFGTILINWTLTVVILVFFGYATRFIGHFDAYMILWWFATTPLALYGAHRVIPWIAPQLLAIDGYRSAVIVGCNDIGRKLARGMASEPTLGFRFRGFFMESDGPPAEPHIEGIVLGCIDAAAEYVKHHGVDTVFIALPMDKQPRLQRLLDEMADTTASIYFVPDIFMFDLIQARIDDINGMPVVAVCESPFVGVNGVVKWASDKMMALVFIVLLSPALALVALGVKLTSPGPVIFRQRRYGVDGREIEVLKFRTMTVVEDGPQVVQATRDDRRVTRLGAFLRRTSLDELPQLFNVLAGTMSIVGPRPHAVAHNETYRRLIRGYMIRHKVKPGITGWAQVNGLRGQTDTVDKMRARIEHDLDYLRRWTLGFDLLIVLKTFVIVWRRTNAY